MRTYRTLALIGTFIKIIGWLIIIGTVLSACGLLVFGIGGSLALPGLTGQNIPVSGLALGAIGQVIGAVIYVLAGLIAGALQIATGELIELFIDLSTSSQRSVQLLERLARAPFPPEAAVAAPAPLPAPGPNPPPQPYGTQ
jgi:hypothetical protein